MSSSAVPAENDGSGSSSQNGAIRPVSCSNCNSVAVASGAPPPDDSAVFESWCQTQVKIVKFKFAWTINNFSFCKEKTGDVLESATFLAGSDEELKWKLRAYPKGALDKSKDYFSLFLTLVSCRNQTEVMTKYHLYILNSKFEKAENIGFEDKAKFALEDAISWGHSYFIKLEVLLDKENGLLPDDNLTIICEGSAAVNRVNISGLSSGHQVELPDSSFSEDFGSLFENHDFSDVTLSVGSKELLVHKAVLSARSPVFAAMFKCEMNESNQNRVVIVDMEYKVLEEMLTYIYTGKSPNMESMAEDLLVAAEKYDLAALKKMCEKVLLSSLTVENVVGLLVHADMYCAKQLKAHAIQFINNNVKDIMLTPAWNNVKLTHPHVIFEALEALASSITICYVK